MEEIFNSKLVKDSIKNLFNYKKIELIKRPASYIIRLKKESREKVTRLILLNPKGFTSNIINELPAHPEIRRAKVTIKGGVKQSKDGFNVLKNVIKFSYFTRRNVEVKDGCLYPIIDKSDSSYIEEIKSTRETFFVVKESGEGFYHNLINLSDKWIMLILEKELRLQKEMNIASKTNEQIFFYLIDKVKELGNHIFFKERKLINNIIKLDTKKTIPVLIEALNIFETGKHEPCTIYAIILKLSNTKPNNILKFLKNALKNNEAPKYYLEELIVKIPPSSHKVFE